MIQTVKSEIKSYLMGAEKETCILSIQIASSDESWEAED